MGAQQILLATACTLLIGGVAAAAPRERVAVIDLGPGDSRQRIAAAVVGGGLQLLGDGLDDALAGVVADRDSVELAAAMADAQSKFGALACKDAMAAAQTAISLGAARQAAGLPVPELARAWTYVLLCADREGDGTTAVIAASRVRALGATDVDAKLLARYPEIDALSNRDVMELEIKPEVDGADVWIDFKHAGKAPLKVVIATGSHVIAAAAGSRRGAVSGTVIKKQPVVTVPMPDQAGGRSALATRVASWKGKVPAAKELTAVLAEVKARVAIIRHGDTVEAWGHAGPGEPVRRLGGEDGVRKLDDVAALVALIKDRADAWSSRAPDPDQPLLRDTDTSSKFRRDSKHEDDDKPTKWWVYATIAAAVVAGALTIYIHDTQKDVQRVELTYP